MLLGRLTERAALSGLLEAARGGHSAVLVVHGEVGVGKTALLEVSALTLFPRGCDQVIPQVLAVFLF